MLTIRLSPTGRKGRISYRVVVSEKRSKLVGKMIDDLGFYNPLSKPEIFEIDTKRVAYWQEKGASVSDSVKKLIETRLV